MVNSILICGGSDGQIGLTNINNENEKYDIISTPKNKASISVINAIKHNKKWILAVGGQSRGKIHLIELPLLKKSNIK